MTFVVCLRVSYFFIPVHSYQYVHTTIYFYPDHNIVTLYILENKLQGMEASASRTWQIFEG